MKTNNKFILEICKRNGIVDYLASKNILPTGRTSNPNRIKFCCPIHLEKHPSFMVYLDPEGDVYHCFGCKAHGNIISLYARLENIPFKEAIKYLGKDININSESELDYILHDLYKELEEEDFGKSTESEVVAMLLNFSVLGHSFLQEVDFDNDAIEWIEKVYKIIDGFVSEGDVDSLQEIYEKTLQDKLFSKKLIQFRKKYEQKQKQLLKAKIVGNPDEEQ